MKTIKAWAIVTKSGNLYNGFHGLHSYKPKLSEAAHKIVDVVRVEIRPVKRERGE